MGSLKDDHYEATIVRESKTAAGAADEKSATSTAATAGAEAGDVSKETIETGSIKTSDECQGEHIAYQATREYLKNFGPKPPDTPGEKGPCRKGE
jgi:hypothetical protein